MARLIEECCWNHFSNGKCVYGYLGLGIYFFEIKEATAPHFPKWILWSKKSIVQLELPSTVYCRSWTIQVPECQRKYHNINPLSYSKLFHYDKSVVNCWTPHKHLTRRIFHIFGKNLSATLVRWCSGTHFCMWYILVVWDDRCCFRHFCLFFWNMITSVVNLVEKEVLKLLFHGPKSE